ncbi:N-acetylmannosamine-6-phosphate 2-epimerase [Selenomonas ruminantium]|uniref:Putative N-acetylmannosamine-6-phosphate 2-epimerase n=1 Tax=Selenomonas ruminantium TaxID=971 RepID=A0A1H3W9G7_SELRU|nr:N-acetylmannosamine-6-phosphate 2-epimerase [Selenomonas ruminantium]SDZ83735.1 N-acylglucosamine-6-phosphate 2-epimerase [Selenomonas ruminantium]
MSFLADVQGKLIVSCQALPDEPLHSSFIMGRMALAAKEGGAVAIRAQSSDDIREIQKVTGLPVIGLVKRNYEDSPIYITPTMAEVEDLLTTDCEMIALDMTDRPRPQGEKLPDLLARIHEGGRLVLADISTYEEGMAAAKLGADAISTTLSGYTPYSPQLSGPDVELVAALSRDLDIPVFAEGRINEPADIQRVMAAGAYAPIVGSAITRPQLITARFAQALSV